MAVNKRQRTLKNGRKIVRWLAQISAKGIKPFSQTFERKIDAENWERQEREKLMRSAAHGVTHHRDMTVGELAAYWRKNYAASNLQFSSQDRYQNYLEKHILPEFANTRLIDLRIRNAERWRDSLHKDKRLHAKTANDCLRFFSGMLNHSVRWEFITHNPIRGMRSLKTMARDFRFWTQEEARRFLDIVLEKEPALYPLFFVALNTGMRLGEIEGLRWDCVDLPTKKILVKRSWCQKACRLKEVTKTHSIRHVPINSALAAVLIELKASDNSGYVLPRIYYKHMARKIIELCRGMEVKVISFHDIRHSFASMWMMSGGNLYELQKVLGHKSVHTTEIYAHLAPGHLEGATEFLRLERRENLAQVIPMAKSHLD
jgi:integrase